MLELLRRLLQRPAIMTEILVASLFINLLALASTLYVIQVLNRYVTFGVDTTLATLTVGLIIAAVMELCFRMVRNRLAAGLNVERDWNLAEAAFSTLVHSRPWLLAQLPQATRQEVMRGVDTIQQTYAAPNLTAVVDLPFAMLFIAVLYLVSPLLGVIATVGVGSALLIVVARGFASRAPARAQIESIGTGRALISTAIQNADTLRAFNGADVLLRAWMGARAALQSTQRRLVGKQGTSQAIQQCLGTMLTAAVIGVGAVLVVRGELTVGTLIGANILAARALAPVAQFARLVESFASAGQAQRLLHEFLKLPTEANGTKALRAYTGRLEFKDVAFSHPGSTGPLFESLSFHLDPGQVLVVTGGNGTGKTSFARLLLDLIEPSRGQIFADGVDLRQLSPEWWRRQVAYVPQEPSFLNLSIAENIRINAPDLGDEDLAQAIAASASKDYLNSTSDGTDTLIVDNGRTLPVGIRRRLALARALVTHGQLCVFDEPTEGLDAAGAQAVYKVLNELAQAGRTLIVASHDPDIVRGAHLVLDLNTKPVPRLLPNPALMTTSRLSQETVPEEAGMAKARAST